jgi:hypothetical protein
MSMAKNSGTSMIGHERDTRKTYASFKVIGDALDPQQMTRILRVVPTVSYAKGEKYWGGERTGQLLGKTGLWLFSTDGIVASPNLNHHLAHIVSIFLPGPNDVAPLANLHALLARQKGMRAEITCFWHGRFGAKRPSVQKTFSEFPKLVPADLELDFDTDSEEPKRQRA